MMTIIVSISMPLVKTTAIATVSLLDLQYIPATKIVPISLLSTAAMTIIIIISPKIAHHNVITTTRVHGDYY